MKVLVTGGRDFKDYKLLSESLTRIFEGPRSHPMLPGELPPSIRTPDEIIHGAARGADTLAQRYAEENNIPVRRYPADWKLYGKRAGFERNRRMLDETSPDLVVAFPGGKGTEMMIKLARLRLIPITQIIDKYTRCN